GPMTSAIFGVAPALSLGTTHDGMITNGPPPGSAGVAVVVAASRSVSRLPAKPSCRWPAWIAAAIFGVAITGTAPPGPGRASRCPGNAGNGVAATRAAYRAGSTTSTPVLIALPGPVSKLAASGSPGATAYTASLCVTPGTAAIARCAAGGTTCW